MGWKWGAVFFEWLSQVYYQNSHMNPIHHKPLQLRKVGGQAGVATGNMSTIIQWLLAAQAVIKLGLGSLGTLIKARDISQWDHLSVHNYHVDGDSEVGQGGIILNKEVHKGEYK